MAIANHLHFGYFDYEYESFQENLRDCEADKRVLHHMLPEILQSTVRKAFNDPLVTSIEARAEAVLKIEGHPYDEKTKTQYVEYILQYLTRGGKLAAIERVLRSNDPLSSSTERADLTSAAAVGSLCAVKELLEENESDWPSWPYFRQHATNDNVYIDPLRAASSNGHIEVVQHLLKALKDFGGAEKWTDTFKHRFQCILNAAIQSRHRQTILTLAVVARKNGICESSLTHVGLSCAELWIRTAITTGCMDTFKTTMAVVGSTAPISAKTLVAYAMLFACEYGQVDILRHLIAHNPTCFQREGPVAGSDIARRYKTKVEQTLGISCMQTAAQYLQRHIIDVLLEHGVSINTGSPIIRAIEFENISIVKYMLDHGADYNRHIHKECLTQLGPSANRALSEFKETDMLPVIFYLVAKHMGKPRYSFRKNGVEQRLMSFVEDIEGSEFWRGKVEAVLGKEMFNEPRCMEYQRFVMNDSWECFRRRI
ncbi:hypothetical protein J4E89_008878 [Alternaria sp. Ai002NY15]|nr:hypothetical protein J4E89_008878 [Alternaria sp. Ai002NY15]